MSEVIFTIWHRKRRKDDLTAGDQFRFIGDAREIADEMADHLKYYQVVINNSKGVRVYDSRNRPRSGPLAPK
jgi:hypothetical protein